MLETLHLQVQPSRSASSDTVCTQRIFKRLRGPEPERSAAACELRAYLEGLPQEHPAEHCSKLKAEVMLCPSSAVLIGRVWAGVPAAVKADQKSADRGPARWVTDQLTLSRASRLKCGCLVTHVKFAAAQLIASLVE